MNLANLVSYEGDAGPPGQSSCPGPGLRPLRHVRRLGRRHPTPRWAHAFCRRGTALGLSSAELNDEENLCVQCDACNHGLGAEPVPLKLWAGVIMSRTRKGKGVPVKTLTSLPLALPSPTAPPTASHRSLTELDAKATPEKTPRGARDTVKLKVVKSTSGGGKILTPAEWQVMFKAAMAEAIGVHTTGDLPR